MTDKPLIVLIDDEPEWTWSIASQVRLAGRYDCVTIATTEELNALLEAGRQRESTVLLYDFTFESLDPREVVPRLKRVGAVGLVSGWPNEVVLPLVRELEVPHFPRLGLDFSQAADEVLERETQVRGERE